MVIKFVFPWFCKIDKKIQNKIGKTIVSKKEEEKDNMEKSW